MESLAKNEPVANDVLGCVCRFILEHIYSPLNTGLPPLTPTQVIRGWQSLASRPRTNEYCVITDLIQERHGLPMHDYQPSDDSDLGTLSIQELLKHSVQVDFFNHSIDPANDPARERAFILTSLANSTECAAIFNEYNPLISFLYCDEIVCLNEVDTSHQLHQRYTITLHLSEIKRHSMPMRFTDSVKIKTTNVVTLLDKRLDNGNCS